MKRTNNGSFSSCFKGCLAVNTNFSDIKIPVLLKLTTGILKFRLRKKMATCERIKNWFVYPAKISFIYKNRATKFPHIHRSKLGGRFGINLLIEFQNIVEHFGKIKFKDK